MSKIKWGVIGAGGIADRRTIPGLLQAKNCELVALMDVANTAALAKKYGVPCYDNEKNLLARDDIQAVYIATPVYLHTRQIKMAAAAKKHILCEKPLTLKSAEARGAIAACRKARVLLQEGYMMRLQGAHQRIAEIVRAGEIGRIVSARAQLACWYPRMAGAWRQEPKKGGGGALIDMASHLYDLLEMFMGPIVRVSAIVNTQVQDYPVDDSSTTLLQFKNGAHAMVDAFYCVPDAASRTRLELYGDRGAILTEGTIGQGSGGKLEVYREKPGKGYDDAQGKDQAAIFKDEPFPRVNPYTAECERLAQAILEGNKKVFVNDPAHGIHILQVVEAAYKSAKTGRTIKIRGWGLGARKNRGTEYGMGNGERAKGKGNKK